MGRKLDKLKNRIAKDLETSHETTLSLARSLSGKLKRVVGQLERGKYPMRDGGMGRDAAEVCDQLAELNILRSYLASLEWATGPDEGCDPEA